MPDLNEHDDPPRPAPRRRRQFAVVLALVIAGLAAIAGGAVGVVHQLTGHATPAQAQAAARAEVASRWERLPAGQIFPSRMAYGDIDGSVQHLTRVGIARPVGCAQAADAALARVLVRGGCRTVLRATYVDSNGVLTVTVGVAVLRSTNAALQVGRAISNGTLGSGVTGVDAYPVPGTVASRFGAAQRQWSAVSAIGDSPYLVLDTGGFTDGRVRTPGVTEPALSSLVDGLVASSPLATILTATAHPCSERDIRC